MSADTDNYLDAFEALAKALEDILTGDTLEDLVKQLAKLPGEAEDVKNHAQSEFDNLSGLNKVKAVAACAEDVIEIKKIPEIVTKTVEGFKKDMMELKEIVEDLKKNQQKYLDDGKKCHEAKLVNPVPCYKHIHGEIKA
jgi:hypothetical protein